MLQRGRFGIQHVQLLLGEVADFQAFGCTPLAGQRSQLFGQGFDQGTFTGTVDAQDADTGTAANHQIDILKHRFLGAAICRRVTGAEVFKHQQRVRHAVGFGQTNINACIDVQRSQRFHAGQRLHTTLSLFCFGGLGFEAVNEAFQARSFAGLAVVGQLGLPDTLGPLRQEVFIAAFVTYQFAVIEVQNGFRNGIQEFGVV